MALEERKNQTHKIESNKKSFQFFFFNLRQTKLLKLGFIVKNTASFPVFYYFEDNYLEKNQISEYFKYALTAGCIFLPRTVAGIITGWFKPKNTKAQTQAVLSYILSGFVLCGNEDAGVSFVPQKCWFNQNNLKENNSLWAAFSRKKARDEGGVKLGQSKDKINTFWWSPGYLGHVLNALNQ